MRNTAVVRFQPHDFELTSQSDRANPFLVRVSATFVHESGKEVADVPGFFDGEGRWVVRFAPPSEGEWIGRTASDDPELDGVDLGPVTAAANDNPQVHGRMVIDPAQPRRFAFEDGDAFVPLGFECDWLFAVHQAKPEAYREFVDMLVERGFNYIVTNLYAHTGFAEPTPGWIFAPPQQYLFEGTNEQPDHAHMNLEFFRDFDAMMDDLHRRGIVVHLMLQVQNKHVTWPTRRSTEDDLFWRYAVSRYQAYGNLVWDVGKESYYFLREFGDHAYTLDRIALIRETDAHGHLVTVHDSLGDSAALDSPADEACDFVSDQIHLGETAAYNREALRRYRAGAKPYMNIEYGYEDGVEAIETYRSETTRPWQDILLWTYAIYFGGGYPCYYYTNAAWDLVKYQPEPPGWPRYRYLMDFLSACDFNALVPDNEFVDRGFCLADPGREYVVFLPEGGEARIDLTSLRSEARGECEWMDVYTGQRSRAPVDVGGFATPLANPLDVPANPCVVAVRAAG